MPVTAGQTTANIDLVLFSGSRVTGTLTLGPTTVLGPHTPPAIEVYYADGTLVKTIPVPAATPGVPVPWEAAGLYFGQHYIRSASQTRVLRQGEGIRPTGGWWIDTLHERIECVAADCLPMRGTPIIVNPGSTTTGINISSEGGATISGSYPFLPVRRVAHHLRLARRGAAEPGRDGPEWPLHGRRASRRRLLPQVESRPARPICVGVVPGQPV